MDKLILANEGVIYDFKYKKFWPSLKNVLFPLFLRLRVTPPIKHFFAKPYYLSITNNEIVPNSTLKPKKFSFLCTLK
jgi:hypothetical protein